jgi:hypothetical protein
LAKEGRRTLPTEKDREKAEEIIPLSNVYFRNLDRWAENRRKLINTIAQALSDARKEDYNVGYADGRMAEMKIATECHGRMRPNDTH